MWELIVFFWGGRRLRVLKNIRDLYVLGDSYVKIYLEDKYVLKG